MAVVSNTKHFDSLKKAWSNLGDFYLKNFASAETKQELADLEKQRVDSEVMLKNLKTFSANLKEYEKPGGLADQLRKRKP